MPPPPKKSTPVTPPASMVGITELPLPPEKPHEDSQAPPRRGLVGKYYVEGGRLGQVVSGLAEGFFYLVQPYDEEGHVVPGQRLIPTSSFCSYAYGYLFFDSLKDALANREPPSKEVSVPKPSVSVSGPSSFPPPPLSSPTVVVVPPAASLPAILAVPFVVPAKTAPAMTEMLPVSPKGSDEDAQVQQALATVKMLEGQHGIVSVVVARFATPPRILVEVDGDSTIAKAAIPAYVNRIEVEIVENVRSESKSVEGGKGEKPASNSQPVEDDQPY
jgi:hypothetical protein